MVEEIWVVETECLTLKEKRIVARKDIRTTLHNTCPSLKVEQKPLKETHQIKLLVNKLPSRGHPALRIQVGRYRPLLK